VSPGPRATNASSDHRERRCDQSQTQRRAECIAGIDSHQDGAGGNESAGGEHLAAIPAADGKPYYRTDRGRADDDLIRPYRASQLRKERSDQGAGYSAEPDR
jgi:hypothetical protein